MDSLAIKETKLRELAHKRQRTTRAGLKKIGDLHNGIYDCDFVSPYTKSANVTIPTVATDGRSIFFNVDFAERIDEKTRRFVLCHEVWHCVMGHLRRRLNREPLRWNMAIDYEVKAICYQLLGYCPDNCLIMRSEEHT